MVGFGAQRTRLQQPHPKSLGLDLIEPVLIYIDVISAAVPARIPAQLVQIAAFRVRPIDDPANQVKIGAHMMQVSVFRTGDSATPRPKGFISTPRRSAGAKEPAKINPETAIPYNGDVWPTKWRKVSVTTIAPAVSMNPRSKVPAGPINEIARSTTVRVFLAIPLIALGI